jgi:hypothetical protein
MGKAAKKRRRRENAAEIHEAIVSRYLMARGFVGRPHDDLDRTYEKALSEAVIYEIPEELFKSIYRAADYYTATEVAGLPWYDVDAHPDPPPEIVEQMPHYWESLAAEGKKQPFPEKLPFDYCYFGFDKPPILSKQQKVTYDTVTAPGDIVAPYAIRMGLLVSREGHAWTLLLSSDSKALIGDYSEIGGPNTEVRYTFSAYPECINGEWTHPLTLAPWFVNALAEWVNDHKVVSVEEVPRTIGFKRMCERVNKKRARVARPVPPHYYAVTMRDQLIMEEDFDKRFPKRRSHMVIDWQHRWLVTAHDRIRVKRGPLPLDPKVEKDLRRPRQGSKNRYLVFKDSHPQGELAKELWRRGVKPKREDEWMAVLVSRITDYVKGPDDKPLIPSTRRSGRSRPFTP